MSNEGKVDAPAVPQVQPDTFYERNAKFREKNWQIRFDAAVEARRQAQEQLYAERERHAREVQALHQEISRLLQSQPAVPQGMRIVPIWLLERVERSLGAFTSDEGWAQTDMDTMDSVSALIAATPATAPAQDEPFGWTDCAKDDEGAIALYERPQEVGLTASQFDLICQALDKADTATMECDYMLDSDDCIAVVRVMQALFDIEALREKQVAKLDYESMYCWLTAGKRGDWIWNHVLTDEEKNLGNDINTVVIAALRAKGQT